MGKIKISENELKQIINESVISILKEDFDYNYGSRNIEIIREIYQLSLKIEKIAEDFGETPISLYTVSNGMLFGLDLDSFLPS